MESRLIVAGPANLAVGAGGAVGTAEAPLGSRRYMYMYVYIGVCMYRVNVRVHAATCTCTCIPHTMTSSYIPILPSSTHTHHCREKVRMGREELWRVLPLEERGGEERGGEERGGEERGGEEMGGEERGGEEAGEADSGPGSTAGDRMASKGISSSLVVPP